MSNTYYDTMKSRMLFLLLLVAFPFLGVIAQPTAPADVPQEKRILIINSYGERTTWSKDLIDSLKIKIHEQYPGWLLYSGNLKTESAIYSPAAALTLRSILWGYAERSHTQVDATSMSYNTLFAQDDCPDAIIWVGEEGVLHYLSYVFQLGRWKEVPMILCAVKDSVSDTGWKPERGFSFDLMENIRNFRTIDKEITADYASFETLENDSAIRLTPVPNQAKPTYRVQFSLNFSGSVIQMPVRQNLELIHRLIPHLQELIWVDDDTYRSMEARLEVERIIGQVLPGVKYSKMLHTRMNTDSIYDVMLQVAPHRAFLTYGWNIDGLYSKRSGWEIDSLFTHTSSVPLFSMTRRDFEKDNYWVGGYYLRYSRLVEKTIRMLQLAVESGNLNTLPFDTLTESRILLNRTALQRYGLERAASQLEGVDYAHLPPTFLQKHEKQLLISMLVLVLVGCYVLIIWRRNRYNKQLQTDYTRYKHLYDKLQAIYANSSMDFALYDESGKRLLRIVSGQSDASSLKQDLFQENIFESTCLDDSFKAQIQAKRTVNCEVSIDDTGKLCRTNLVDCNVYQLIIKPLNEVPHHQSSFMAIAVNLTPTIREREEKEKLEGLFRFASDSSQVGVVFYDATTAVGMATDSWCSNLNEKFLSGNFPQYKYVVREDRTHLLEFQQAIRAGIPQEPLCREIQVNGKDGTQHWMRQYMYFIQASNRLVELNLGIDEQKRDEWLLKEAKQKAEESNEETRQFLCSISHEVRTPLNAIVGFSDVVTALESDQDEEFTPVILRNVHLLDALVANILDLSALDADKVSFRHVPINITQLFAELESYVRSNLYEHPLHILRELPPSQDDCFITTDPDYLRMLFHNLLSNAVKFTSQGSITLGCRKEEDSYYFYVTDTGCGIAPEHKEFIFGRFQKLDLYAQGTGLGLSLCKSIVKHLGGQIGLESEIERGSTFWFVLPCGDVS